VRRKQKKKSIKFCKKGGGGEGKRERKGMLIRIESDGNRMELETKVEMLGLIKKDRTGEKTRAGEDREIPNHVYNALSVHEEAEAHRV
jgi:hypothetical protein